MDNKSSSKNEGSFLFSTSLIFDENIDKLWLILKDLSTEIKVIDFLDNLKLIKGDNTWIVGNIFSVYWVGVSNIEAKCLSSMETRMKKKIKCQYKKKKQQDEKKDQPAPNKGVKITAQNQKKEKKKGGC